MHRVILYLTVVSAVLFLSACREEAHTRQHVVVLVDASASIAPEAFSDAIASAQSLIKHLRRGDALSIIPILGDGSQTQGKILRFEIALERQAYDADITKVDTAVRNALADLRAAVLRKPMPKTDILGAIDVACEEFSSYRAEVQQTLIIFSDLLEDDGRFDFMTAPELATEATAKRLGQRLAIEKPRVMKVRAYVGMLRSVDYDRLQTARRRAVVAFWSTLFSRYGAKTMIATDGPGLMKKFLDEDGFDSEGGGYGHQVQR